MAKIDPGQEATERRIKELEKRIRKEYAEASKSVQTKLQDHLNAFAQKDKDQRALLDAEKITEKEYQQWRLNQMAVGQRWEELKTTLAQDYRNADRIARRIVNGERADVFAINGNFAAYEIEKSGKIDMSFSLYDADSVTRLVRDNPDVLPPLDRFGEQSRIKREIAEGKAVAWEKGQIQSAITQGILQGKAIPELAEYIADNVGARNYSTAVRYARTAMTEACNAGRYASYRRAKDLGVDLTIEWNATLDHRTRHSHRQMHGQRREVDEPFEVDGHEILYPGYPYAVGNEIWNCRCSLSAMVKGYEIDTVTESPKMGDMTFDEWREAKENG